MHVAACRTNSTTVYHSQNSTVRVTYLDDASETVVPRLHRNPRLPLKTPAEVLDDVSWRVVWYLLFFSIHTGTTCDVLESKQHKMCGSKTTFTKKR